MVTIENKIKGKIRFICVILLLLLILPIIILFWIIHNISFSEDIIPILKEIWKGE